MLCRPMLSSYYLESRILSSTLLHHFQFQQMPCQGGSRLCPHNLVSTLSSLYKAGVAAKHLPYASNSTKDILGQAPIEGRTIHILSS